MSQCIVPNWNLSPQRQEQVEPEEGNRSSHVHSLQTLHSVSSHLLPMSEYEIAELTWENGQLAMHGLGGLPPYPPTKPTWCHPTDTLESIVRQAAFHKQSTTPNHQAQAQTQVYAGSASPSRKCADSSWRETMQPPIVTKHARLESDYGGRNNICCSSNRPDLSNCASASATFCRDNDTTLMTWTSFESPQSFKTKTTEDDSTWHGGSTIDYFFQENQKEDRDIKRETGRSNSTRRSRAAAIHNQSERKRRDRINQKMKALQKLVPNACKTDKASMLDEVIEYLKQLQAQVQLMSMRNMPQMIMPLGMQQQLQMSMMARMGMGLGLGLGLGNMARTTPQPPTQLVHPTPQAFVQPPFMMHPMVQPQPKLDSGTNPSVPLPDPFCAYLAQMLRERQLADLQRQPLFFFGQSMNMDLYNKMAALYRQQVNPNTQAGGSSTQSNNVQRN